MKEKEKMQRINSKKCSDDKVKNHCNSSAAKEKNNAKRGWSDVFDKLTYSNGPGDNIYVFG
jgi:hypothetical protein